ncbi:adhesion G-protein coupled receptor G5-like [Xiphias gladius]|uniref:adhesion G-protein coupled receptor G5-like n=1 Tax=Xiphias gladius TaxID=8245 RepID=UPI001A99A822|nr:adhesion G-protein coupled receptor G5-like [Xiphias gladius]
MQRMKWRLLRWLLLSLLSHNITCKNLGESYGLGQGPKQVPGQGQNRVPVEFKKQVSGQGQNQGSCSKWKRQQKEKTPKRRLAFSDARRCMEDVNSILLDGNGHESIKAMESLQQFLEETEVNETMSLSVSHMMAVLHKPKRPFKGLEIYASEKEAMSDQAVANTKVSVRLPRELDPGSDNTIVFCLLTWPETNGTIFGASGSLYENRLVGLSVRGKSISGLQESVNITMSLTVGINETQKPRCVFYNFSGNAYSSSGCLTLWERGQSYVTCSCDHLTYFGVLMVPTTPSPEDREILMYITLIGCSLSLFALVITVFLFITNRNIRADVSMKVHINLAIALILLNLHFLPNQTAAALSSTGLCLYMALSLHYSLLATFSWMALEGFHIYLLLVRVFNIYVNRYLLKLSVVGWGIPAVIVSLVVIIDRGAYGHVSLDSSNSNSSTICYITNDTVKMVTTVGVFGLVFIFNVILLVVTIKRVMTLCHSKESGRDRAKRDICTLLGITNLLGITWGLVFFSFGYLTTPGLYLFCILNPLQGFSIFLWFMLSLRKDRNSAAQTSSETRSTNH